MTCEASMPSTPRRIYGHRLLQRRRSFTSRLAVEMSDRFAARRRLPRAGSTSTRCRARRPNPPSFSSAAGNLRRPRHRGAPASPRCPSTSRSSVFAPIEELVGGYLAALRSRRRAQLTPCGNLSGPQRGPSSTTPPASPAPARQLLQLHDSSTGLGHQYPNGRKNHPVVMVRRAVGGLPRR
jgi:hypothetical protein